MVINAKLNNNTLGLVDLTEPLLLPENELILSLKSDVYNLSTLLVTARNGDKEIKEKVIGNKLVNLSQLLFPGAIEIEISLISKAEAVKTWRLADIIIKDIKHNYEAIPEISHLQTQIDEIKGAIAELTNLLRKNNII